MRQNAAASNTSAAHGLGGENVICVQKLFIYGLDSGQAQSLRDNVQTTSLVPEARHTVSVHLAARLTRFSASFLLSWVSKGERFCQLEWIFPNFQFPKFTTRHVLVQEEASHIAFAGGLQWAYDMLLYLHPSLETSGDLELEHSSTQDFTEPQQIQGDELCGVSYSGSCDSIDAGQTSGVPYAPLDPPFAGFSGFPLPLTHQQAGMTSGLTAKDLTPPEGYPSLGYEDDYSDEPGSPTSLTTGTTRPSSPELPNETHYGRSRPDQHPVDQERTEDFSRQRQAAVAQYEENGDKSAMLSVLNRAAQFDGVWDSAGFARFGPPRDQ